MVEVIDMHIDRSVPQKRNWLRPRLDTLSVTETLGGTQPNPSECRSQNPNAAGLPNYCS